MHHHVTARKRSAAPARYQHGSAAACAGLTTSDLHVAAAPVRVRAAGLTTRQHHGATHTPRRQTSRDLDRASQAFLGAAAHHREVLSLRHVCRSAQIRRDVRGIVSEGRAVARAPVQHGLVRRHADGQSRALVHLQLAVLDTRRLPAVYLNHAPPSTCGVGSRSGYYVYASARRVCRVREAGSHSHVPARPDVALIHENRDIPRATFRRPSGA